MKKEVVEQGKRSSKKSQLNHTMIHFSSLVFFFHFPSFFGSSSTTFYTQMQNKKKAPKEKRCRVPTIPKKKEQKEQDAKMFF
jgi:hypothetical protein